MATNNIYLYYLDMRQTNVAHHELFGVLNQNDQRRYQGFKSSARQAQFILSRWLTKQCLKQLFAQPIVHDYHLTDFCCWNIPEQKKSFSISISHSGHFIAVAIAAFPCSIGLDIEQHKPRNFTELVRSVGTIEEQKLVCQDADQQLCFYRLWTAKEAFLKASKKSIEQVYRQNLVNCLQQPFGQVAGYHYLTGTLAKPQYSYCVMSDSDANVHVLDFALSHPETFG